MEEEGVPSTTLREISLLKMLSESNHIVKCVARQPALASPLRQLLFTSRLLLLHACRRLMSVEHTEENNKPCLYLVRAGWERQVGGDARRAVLPSQEPTTHVPPTLRAGV